MHSAPSVSFPVGRSRFQARLLLALWLSGGLGIAAWRLQAEADGAWLAAMLAVLSATGALAWRAWRRAPQGMLCWRDGQWCFVQAAPGAGLEQPLQRLRPVLDLQDVLLLRVQAQGRPDLSWLWLARSADPTAWRALRRAVHGRVPRADAAAQAQAAAGPAQGGAAP